MWQYIQPASQPQTTWNHTGSGPPHPACSPPRSSETSCCNDLTWAGKYSHSTAPGTLERCSLHGWILVFTVQGRWQTACEASCGLMSVMWIHGGGEGYGVVRRMLEVWSWGSQLCRSSTIITSCCSMIMHPLSMSGMLWIRHVHDTYTTACSSSCQYPATSHSHWREVDQHSTFSETHLCNNHTV